ncbi:DUF4937 domain-containing protein [Kitasatospora sp. NPDC089509]|uniref:DUF4937 domain-containing protein n=1 Tax=Kitasatospora sp. NPDC089509 TaxID=3364079 RepID=UPI003829B19B
MWAKWIDCQVRPDARAAFAAGQRRWSAMADQPGLIGQLGGWSRTGDRALLLALWTDETAYRRFMRERHDEIATGAAQQGSWEAIRIASGPVALTMPGSAPSVPEVPLVPEAPSLPEALRRAALLRVADCELHPGRTEHFLTVQHELWAPGMAAAGGLLTGAVTRLSPTRHLVTTLWTTPEAHAAYVADALPALLARADVPADVAALTGHAVPLEPGWLVLP